MNISGEPKLFKNSDGVIQTTAQALLSVRTLNPELNHFLSGYPWIGLNNDGSRLLSLGTTNAYASIDSIFESNNHIDLLIKKQTQVFPNYRDYFDKAMRNWVHEPAPFDYACGIITYAHPLSMGRIKISCKMPEGLHLWPSIWLFSSNPSSAKEIDIIEAYTGSLNGIGSLPLSCNQLNTYCHTGYANLWLDGGIGVVPNSNSNNTKYQPVSGQITPSMVNEQVDYECLWTPEGLLVYYNEVLVWVVVFTNHQDFQFIKEPNGTANLIIENKPYSNSDFYIANTKINAADSGKRDQPSPGSNEFMRFSWFEYEPWNGEYPGGESSLRSYLLNHGELLNTTFTNLDFLGLSYSELIKP
jgi:hypothetical protein